MESLYNVSRDFSTALWSVNYYNTQSYEHKHRCVRGQHTNAFAQQYLHYKALSGVVWYRSSSISLADALSETKQKTTGISVHSTANHNTTALIKKSVNNLFFHRACGYDWITRCSQLK